MLREAKRKAPLSWNGEKIGNNLRQNIWNVLNQYKQKIGGGIEYLSANISFSSP